MSKLNVDAYLRRLGIAEPPVSDADMLQHLHSAHTERISYESFDVLLGLDVPLDPVRSGARFAAGRGGHCFELNGAFALLLSELGYHVRLHSGGVQFHNEQPNVDGMHVTVTVHGAVGGDPEDSEDVFLVDVGMGDALHAPLPLSMGAHEQGPFSFTLSQSTLGPGYWRLGHDATGNFSGMDFAVEPTTLEAFDDNYRWVTTSPDSILKHVCVLARLDESGKDVLNALELRRVSDAPDEVTLIEDEESWWDAVGDVFSVHPEFTPAQRDQLWRTVVAIHERNLERAGQETGLIDGVT